MIRVVHDGALATITLDRGGARNAIPLTGWQQLAQVGPLVEDASLVVLRSADRVFSAGADLDELARLAAEPERRAPFREAMRAGIDAVAALPMPVVALVEGGCFGAAVALILACDWRIAGPDACFAVPPARLGIGYPAEDVARLAAQVGRGQAARLLSTARTIDSAEALRIGLVEVVAEAPDLALANDPAALRELKRVLADPTDPNHAALFENSFDNPAFARFAAARIGPTG